MKTSARRGAKVTVSGMMETAELCQNHGNLPAFWAASRSEMQNGGFRERQCSTGASAME